MIPARLIAACFALAAFAAAALVGVAVGNSGISILVGSILAMAVCWCIGRLIGGLAQRAVDEHIGGYKQQHPMPGEAESEAAEASGAEEASP